MNHPSSQSPFRSFLGRLSGGAIFSLALAASLGAACGGGGDSASTGSGGTPAGGRSGGATSSGGTQSSAGGKSAGTSGTEAGETGASSGGGSGTTGEATGGAEAGGSGGTWEPGAGGDGGAQAGSGGEGGGEIAESVTDGDRRIPFTPPDDRTFLDFFIEHHRVAVEMATREFTHGEREAVKALADDILIVQTNQMEFMEAVRVNVTGVTLPAAPSDAHQQTELSRLRTSSGAELDELFLTAMIAHHASGLPVAHRALGTLTRSELRALAGDMVNMRAQEIGNLHGLLQAIGKSDAGEDAAPVTPGRADIGLRGDRRIPMTPANDIEFIDYFVPHHELAVDLASHAAEHGADAQVKNLAGSIRDAQAEEILALRAVRQSLSSSGNTPAPPADSYMVEKLQEMLSLSGSALDKMFLLEMIVHHATGIPTAHRAKPHVTNAELRDLSDATFQDQSAEIGVMSELLQKFTAK